MKTALGVAAALLLATSASADTVIKVGSLAPRESPWGQVLRVWMKAVKEKSKGAVTIEIYWNGTQGDEPAMVSKMKTGQLDAAIITTTGLGLIDPDVNVFAMPGLFATWEKLDAVRTALQPRFEKSFHDAGFELVGWGDIGLDRILSKGFVVRVPSDIKGHRPWVWREDPVTPSVFQVVGVMPVPTSVPEVLPELSTGNIDSIVVSPLAAEQLQWASHFDTMNLMVVDTNIGAAVITRSKLDSLSPELRTMLLETSRIACKALTSRIRAEDDLALERLKKRVKVVEPTAEELATWQKVFAEARVRLGKGTLPAALVKEAETLSK